MAAKSRKSKPTSAKKSSTKKPVAKKPVAKKPAAKKPAAKKPVAKKPVVKKKPAAVNPGPGGNPGVNPPVPGLLSASDTDKHLEEVGSRVVAARLSDAALRHLALAAEDDATLAPLSFNAGWREALQPYQAQLQATVSKRDLDAGAAHPTSAQVDDALTRGEALIKRMHTVLSVAPHAVSVQAPHLREPHSPREMGTALTTLADFVDAHAAELEPYGADATLSQSLRSTATALGTARNANATARAKVAPDVRSVWKTAGIIYLEMVRLSKAAHGVLPASRSALYSMEELHPRQHHGKPASPPPATGTGNA